LLNHIDVKYDVFASVKGPALGPNAALHQISDEDRYEAITMVLRCLAVLVRHETCRHELAKIPCAFRIIVNCFWHPCVLREKLLGETFELVLLLVTDEVLLKTFISHRDGLIRLIDNSRDVFSAPLRVASKLYWYTMIFEITSKHGLIGDLLLLPLRKGLVAMIMDDLVMLSSRILAGELFKTGVSASAACQARLFCMKYEI
jgi:hypothetical protein